MSDQPSCPAPERLKQLLDGALPPEEQTLLTAHLDQCQSCQDTVESMTAGKQSWADVAECLARGESAAEPALAEALDAVRAEAARTATLHGGAPVEISLDFLDPADKPDTLGKLDHYEITEVIGRGGNGVVLKAFDNELHRVVAIKVLAPQLATSATARKRFRRESKAAAGVSHDHVVGIHEVGETKGVPYLVMQYVAGQSVQEKIEKNGPLELKEILRIGHQAACGLAAAHAQGLVHRDIKPANILLENGVERVKITDFGLARAVDDASLTQTGVVAGTPQYMAPEQASGSAVDHRADLFSLGSVMYAMCTGHPPFRATTTMAVLKRVCEETPRPIREINPDMPQWLCDIIGKLHAKNPAERFQTAKEVAELLEQCLAHVQQPDAKPLPVMVSPPIITQQEAEKQPGDYWHTAWSIAGWVLAVLGLLTLKFSDGFEWLGIVMCLFSAVLLVQSAIRRVLKLLTPGSDRDSRQEEAPPSGDWVWARVSGGVLLPVGTLFLAFRALSGEPWTTPATLLDVGLFVGGLVLLLSAWLGGRPHATPSIESEQGASTKGVPVLRIALSAMGMVGMFLVLFLFNWIRLGLFNKWIIVTGGVVFALLGVFSLYYFIHQRRGQLRAARVRRITEICSGILFIIVMIAVFEYTGTLNLIDRVRPLFYHELTLSVRDKKTAVEVWSTDDTDEKAKERSYTGQLELEPVKTIFNLNQKRVRLAPGNYWMRVTKDGALAEERLLKIEWGGKQNLILGEWYGRVHVENYNTGVTVYVDGSSIRSGGSMAFGAGNHSWKAISKYGKEVASGQFLLQGESTYTLVVPPIDKEVGFVPLFNGKDLTGWESQPDQPGNWKVEKAHLVGTGPISSLVSKRQDFENFHFRAQVKIQDGHDSGEGAVLFHCNPSPLPGNEASLKAIEVEIKRTGRNTVQASAVLVPFEGSRTVIQGKTSTLLKGRTSTVPVEEWFTLDFTIHDDQIFLEVDGESTLGGGKFVIPKRLQPKGTLAFQVGAPGVKSPVSVIEFRRIEIKELPAAEPKWVQLFNGKDLTGWLPQPSDTRNWHFENGILIGNGGKSYLVSKRDDYRNFHLRAEVKINPSGDSGLYFRCRPDELLPRGIRSGYEAQIIAPAPATSRTGSLFKFVKGETQDLKLEDQNLIQADTWFALEVIADGNRIIVKVDGKVTADYLDVQPIGERNHIVLDTYTIGTRVQFKKLEIKELTATNPGFIGAHKDEESLQGSWKLVSIETDGEKVPEELTPLMNLSVTFTGDRFQSKWLPPGDTPLIPRELMPLIKEMIKGMKTDVSGIYHLNTARNPRRITVLAPNDSTNSFIGIYRVEGDTLTMCTYFETEEIKYPAEFTTKPKDGRLLAVFKRDVLASAFIPLFNGKDLTGWRTVGGTPGTWKVQDGVLRGTGSASYLVSDGSYADFHLKAEVRTSPRHEWGMDFRTDRAGNGCGLDMTYKRPTNDVLKQIMMELRFSYDGKPGAVLGSNFKPDEWHPIEFIAKGEKVEIRVAGGSLGGGKLSLTPGPIILRLPKSDSILEFRKIEIKELPSADPLASPPPSVLKTFDPAKEKPIAAGYVDEGKDGLRFTTDKTAKLRLFEVATPGVDNCRLIFRAKLKSVEAREAYLRMIARFPGEEGAMDTIGKRATAATGDTNWTTYEVTLDVKPGQKPSVVELNLQMEGRERDEKGLKAKNQVWIKDIEFLKAPLKQDGLKPE